MHGYMRYLHPNDEPPWPVSYAVAASQADMELAVRSPSSVPALKTRTAISPLFAHKIRLKGVFSAASICTELPVQGT